MKSSGVASGTIFDRGIRSIPTSQGRRIQHSVAALLLLFLAGQSSILRNSTTTTILIGSKTKTKSVLHVENASISASEIAKSGR